MSEEEDEVLSRRAQSDPQLAAAAFKHPKTVSEGGEMSVSRPPLKEHSESFSQSCIRRVELSRAPRQDLPSMELQH